VTSVAAGNPDEGYAAAAKSVYGRSGGFSCCPSRFSNRSAVLPCAQDDIRIESRSRPAPRPLLWAEKDLCQPRDGNSGRKRGRRQCRIPLFVSRKGCAACATLYSSEERVAPMARDDFEEEKLKSPSDRLDFRLEISLAPMTRPFFRVENEISRWRRLFSEPRTGCAGGTTRSRFREGLAPLASVLLLPEKTSSSWEIGLSVSGRPSAERDLPIFVSRRSCAAGERRFSSRERGAPGGTTSSRDGI
jgi:hypothetical protein